MMNVMECGKIVAGRPKYKDILEEKYDDITSDFIGKKWCIILNGAVLTCGNRPQIAWRNAYQILEKGFDGLRYQRE